MGRLGRPLDRPRTGAGCLDMLGGEVASRHLSEAVAASAASCVARFLPLRCGWLAPPWVASSAMPLARVQGSRLAIGRLVSTDAQQAASS
jgi:hypothetical protein